MIKKLFIMFLFSALATPLIAEDKLEVNPSRLVKVLGPVNASIIEKANELIKLSELSKDPIYLFINSPGGSVGAGNVFIDAMTIVKNRGIQINCVTSVYAASMAFSILMNCSERYVLENVKLLFHPARVFLMMTALTGKEYQKIAEDLISIDTKLQKELLEKLEIDEDIMLKAYYDEKWWDISELQAVTKKGWLKVVKDISGIKDLFALTPGKINQSDILKMGKGKKYVIFNSKDN